MPTCTTCASWSLKRAGAMAKHHFGLCDKQPAWAFYPPTHTCPKHAPAAADITAARIKWLKK